MFDEIKEKIINRIKNRIYKIKNFITNAKEWFALLGVIKQLSVVLIIGLMVVSLSSLIIGSVENSYLIFVDPPSLPEVKEDKFKIFFSFFLMLFGLIVTGFIISVLSSSLENTFRDIRSGRLNYSGFNHTIIINYSYKVEQILNELNLYHMNHKDIHDVVILIKDEADVEKLKDHIKELDNKLQHLKIFIRYGDVLSIKRYQQLSLLNVNSIIVLSDDKIEELFDRDNNSIRIVNLLFTDPNFKPYLARRKKAHNPVKAIVELENIDHSSSIIEHMSSSLFQAISPNNILASILSLSMININFYNLWSKLLSFNGYEVYFVSAQKYNLVGSSYKEVLLRHQNGLFLGISRGDGNGGTTLLLNEQSKTIEAQDWLIFIAKDKNNSISFIDEPIKNIPKEYIAQPPETYTKNIAILGDKKDIKTNGLIDLSTSKVSYLDPSKEDYANPEFYLKLVQENDTIIMNMHDELVYRLALALKAFFEDKIPPQFVFLVDDSLISTHLETAEVKNVIIPHHLVSKYMAQLSNQLGLYDVFYILFEKHGAEVNFIDIADIPKHILSDINQLKVELINQNMVYLGCENNDRSINFEATDLRRV